VVCIVQSKLPTFFSSCQDLFKKSKENQDFSLPCASHMKNIDLHETDKNSDTDDLSVGSIGSSSAKNPSNLSRDKVIMLCQLQKYTCLFLFS
jgi:hypothetical protein